MPDEGLTHAGGVVRREGSAGPMFLLVRASRAVNVRYFAMRYLGEVPPSEPRDTRWCGLDECEQLLRWETSRALVRAAAGVTAGSL